MKIQVASKEITIERAKLKNWLLLSDLLQRAFKEKEHRNHLKVAEIVYRYNTLGCKDIDIDWSTVSWDETLAVFTAIAKENKTSKKFPIFAAKEKKERDDPIPWDYETRTWYMWAHMLASHYCWKLDEIAELDIDDAIPLLQEIIVEEQLKKEFEWSMSEIAYPYNTTTKKNIYKPLERPEWMKPVVSEIKKIKIRKDFVPMGNVIDLGKMGTHAK